MRGVCRRSACGYMEYDAASCIHASLEGPEAVSRSFGWPIASVLASGVAQVSVNVMSQGNPDGIYCLRLVSQTPATYAGLNGPDDAPDISHNSGCDINRHRPMIGVAARDGISQPPHVPSRLAQTDRILRQSESGKITTQKSNPYCGE
jgi:hypothetical protein